MAHDTKSTSEALPTLDELPDPPSGKTGWPWTEQSDPLPETQPDGTPWPRITIVTPSYNQASFLEETIRSILLQGYPNLEYIVTDGESTDGTVEILERYDPWIDHWVSEPDDGQADAIQKGLEEATGDIEAYLNSDDVLLPGALEEVAGMLLQNPDAAWGTGDAVYFSDDVSSPERVFRADEPKMPHLIFGQPFPQQSTFWRAPARREVGFDSSFQFCMDAAFFTRLQDAFGPPCLFDRTISGFRVHEEAKSSNWGPVLQSEIKKLSRYWERRYSGWKRLRLKHMRKTWKVRQAFTSYYTESDYGKTLSPVDLAKVAASYPPGLFHRQTLGTMRRILLHPKRNQ
jgi:glycosyltransferase involved in cell wall biosynthesis